MPAPARAPCDRHRLDRSCRRATLRVYGSRRIPPRNVPASANTTTDAFSGSRTRSPHSQWTAHGSGTLRPFSARDKEAVADAGAALLPPTAARPGPSRSLARPRPALQPPPLVAAPALMPPAVARQGRWRRPTSSSVARRCWLGCPWPSSPWSWPGPTTPTWWSSVSGRQGSRAPGSASRAGRTPRHPLAPGPPSLPPGGVFFPFARFRLSLRRAREDTPSHP